MIERSSKLLPLAVFCLTIVWYAALVIRFPTHGAIGNDPATYVQMALDLAQRGAVTHEFPLFNNLYDQGLSWDAVIAPGYHIVPVTDVIVPNFAFGFPVLLALGYRLFGEPALYWLTPFMGMLCLFLTFALAQEFWRELSPARRYWVGALAALLLVSTPRQIQLILVPMSDVPTQLFCLLAMWLGLSAFQTSDPTSRYSGPVFAALCGISLGAAYLIRHSAIVMLVPLAIVAWWHVRNKSSPVRKIAIALVALTLTMVPDILYRTGTLGSPFAVESPESTQLYLADAPRQIVQSFGALFSISGFGPLLLVILALAFVWREKQERFAIGVLAAWIIALVFFHAPLFLTSVFENNLRYLLPAYPAIALLVGRALVVLFDLTASVVRKWRKDGLSMRERSRAIVLVGCILAAAILFMLSVRAVAGPERFVLRSYGWMSEIARADLDAVSQSLPQNAVIGVSDQMAGAVMLYAKRDIFRPASFRERETEFFLLLQRMSNANRDVYLIGDWSCSPFAGASESLPPWLADVETTDLGAEIRDLPYECKQTVRKIK